MSRKTLVIGVGNDFRGDDAAGLIVARRLKNFPPLKIIESNGDGAMLMELWQGFDHVIIIDAICSGSPAGSIYRIDAHQQNFSTDFFRSSTHTFGLAEAIEMARILNQLPPDLIVFGIEGKHFEFGTEISPEVETAIANVVEEAKEEGVPEGEMERQKE